MADKGDGSHIGGVKIQEKREGMFLLELAAPRRGVRNR